VLVISSGLLLAAWIIGWLVFEIPSRRERRVALVQTGHYG